jgi:hypothetical protein
MSRRLPPGEAPISGRVQKRSTGMLSGSSSCPKARSRLCQKGTGYWRSEMPSAAGARLRWTGPLVMICSGPAYGWGPEPGTRLLGLRGIFRRTWSGRDLKLSWRHTGTRSASRRSHRPPRGSAHLSAVPCTQFSGTGRRSRLSRRRWLCRPERARPKPCWRCW